MLTYNLITEPWIPVLFLDGTVREIGLRDAIVHAHEIREVTSDSPVEVAAINRLLLALTVRVYPETEDEDAWFDRWHEGFFPTEPADKYFEHWKDRFDLFHLDRPFYQVKNKIGEKLLDINTLYLDQSNHVDTLFSHADIRQNQPQALKIAARGIISTQFARPGGTSSQPFRYTAFTPSINSTTFWAKSQNLFRDLLLNAPPSTDCRMGGYNPNDIPAWEQPHSIKSEKRTLKGFLDYLTFQHRRLTLANEEAGEIRNIRITGGDSIEEHQLTDPHICIIIKNKSEPPRRYIPKSSRALWRDASLFMTLVSGKSHPPRVFQWIASYEPYLQLSSFLAEGITIKSRSLTNGTIEFWRHETIPVYSKFLWDTQAGTEIIHAINNAEEQAQNLRKSCETVSAQLLFHKTTLLSKKEQQQAAKHTLALDPENRYWARIEQPFYDVLRRLGEESDYTEIRRNWARTLHITALKAFDQATSSLNNNANQIRARVEGQAKIHAVIPYRTPELENTTIEL